MNKRFLPFFILVILISITTFYSCTKLDTTTLGGDLVGVDNINTFADTLSVISEQGFFNDSSTTIQKNENHVIGNITNDPLFGKTNGALYIQFKPTFYPFYFGNAGDTVKNFTGTGFDSAFICLSYKGAWGDTSAMALAQTFEVRAIVDNDFKEKTDTLRGINYKPTIDATLLGSASITASVVKSKIKIAYGKDSVESQIRIPLTAAGAAYAASIFNNQDSTTAGTNNAFLKDSIFREKFNGFEIKAVGAGNTLFYVNIGDAKSRLEFHYFKRRNNIRDTAIQSFQFYTFATATARVSSSANFIQRDYTGFPVATPSSNFVYLQTSPGTFANLKIPQLSALSNRVIHRAYLIAEQEPNNVASDLIYTPPPFLYLDLKDSSFANPQRYKPVYFDLSSTILYNPDATSSSSLYHPFPASNVDVNTFGGGALRRTDANGNVFFRYEINLTRYVQHIVTNGFRNYDLRLYSPYNYTYPQYTGVKYIIPFYNPIALGGVRLGSGTNPNHKMKMVVIYSKI